MLWARALRERNVTGVVDWDTLHGNVARQRGQWMSEEARVDLAKVTGKVDSRCRGRELAKEWIKGKGKAKAGQGSVRKAVQALTKGDGEKEVERDTKAHVGTVVKWVTRQGKANVEARVGLIGQSRKSRKSKVKQCKVWK